MRIARGILPPLLADRGMTVCILPTSHAFLSQDLTCDQKERNNKKPKGKKKLCPTWWFIINTIMPRGGPYPELKSSLICMSW